MSNMLEFNAEEARKLAESHADKPNMDDIKWVLQKIKYHAERGEFKLEVSKDSLSRLEVNYLEKELGYKIEDEENWWIIEWC